MGQFHLLLAHTTIPDMQHMTVCQNIGYCASKGK